MVKPCPNCGAKSVPEARFCRSCGTPLKVAGGHDTDPPVSPLAQTIPLAGEGRTTDGLSADDQRPNASNTTKVGREEIEQILRRVQADYTDLDDGKKVAPETAKSAKPHATVPLAPKLAATTAAQSPDSSSALVTTSASSQPAPASTTRRRSVWPLLVVALLGIVIAVGVWAVVHSRKANSPDTSNAGNASPAQASDEKLPEDEKTSATETQPLTEQTVEPTPSTAEAANQAAKNMEHPKAARNDSQTNAQKAAEPSASVAPTPSVVQTPAPKTNAAQLSADDYYFMGVNTVNGRNPKDLKDGELNAALNYFLRARGGAHGEEARKYADRLGREFDRRRKR
jgi:hypothetical protein